MAIAFTILALLAYIAISYFVITKLIIPTKLIAMKIVDSVILAGLGAAIVTALVKLL